MDDVPDGVGSVDGVCCVGVLDAAKPVTTALLWRNSRRPLLVLVPRENAAQALTDLRTRSLASLSPTPPAFTALRGFQGNGTSAYVDFGVAASALTQFTQNSAHIGFYVQSGDGATSTWVGARDSGSGFSSDITSMLSHSSRSLTLMHTT